VKAELFTANLYQIKSPRGYLPYSKNSSPGILAVFLLKLIAIFSYYHQAI
jgi:hypothetical protein